MTIENPTTAATFLNYNSYNTAGVAGTLTPDTDFPADFKFHLNVGLVLERSGGIDPTATGGLLTLNWAERQAALASLNADGGSPWSTYGASTQDYTNVQNALATLHVTQASSPGYISSQDSRTIWVEVNESNFSTLLGADAIVTHDESGSPYLSWRGALAFNPALGPAVQGLVFDIAGSVVLTTGIDLHPVTHDVNFITPVMPSTPPAGSGVELQQGAQSRGNWTTDRSVLFPNEIAALYHFPLTDSDDTLNFPTIGLIEPGLGDASPSLTHDLSHYLNDYLTQAGLTDPHVVVRGVQAGGTLSGSDLDNGERVLDMSVVGAVAPQSRQVLYAGSGHDGKAQSSTFTAYQSAIFDTTYKPQIVSSSWGMDANNPAPGTAFAWTFQQMFIDAALANITLLVANGDVGSGRRMGSGVANTALAENSPYNLMVGGTSVSTNHAASGDNTLSTTWHDALLQTPATLWTLVQGGLTSVPAVDNPKQWFSEMVWNQYYVTGTAFTNPNANDSSYFGNFSGAGGLDSGQLTPSYQAAYGLTHEGRGLPDVAAQAGGNTDYKVPQSDWSTSTYAREEGTSAATPLWASLIAQIDTVFNDQGLPNLGYMNDLLYIASAIAPAAFNDVTVGNNTSSFYNGAGAHYYTTSTDNSTPTDPITPTDIGYEAGRGYDFASGLGSPNGLVLARTLSAIANTQTNNHVSDTSYAVIDIVDDTGGTAQVAQTLLVQSNYSGATVVHVDGTDAVTMGGNDSLGWTSRLAGQVVQGDNFDSALVALFDGGAKSVPYEISVLAGATLGVSAGGQELALYQQLLTNDYGFLQFSDARGGITLARPVAVAQTAGGASDQDAILRIRQNGGDDAKLEIYRVDDLNGTIGGVAPGQAGYEAAAAGRDYHLKDGGTVINGPGWGNFTQVEITGVDQGDYLALKYTNVTTNDIYLAFSQGNVGNVTAIYNYGLNTWGFEDRPLTGDHDYQDIVVQIDFTSASGHHLLA